MLGLNFPNNDFLKLKLLKVVIVVNVG